MIKLFVVDYNLEFVHYVLFIYPKLTRLQHTSVEK